MNISSLQPIAFGRCKVPREKRNYEVRNIKRNTAKQAHNISKWLNDCGLTSRDGKVSLTAAKPLEELRDCIQNTRPSWRKMSLKQVSARAKSIIRIAKEWIKAPTPRLKAELRTVQSLADFIDNPPAEDALLADLKKIAARTRARAGITITTAPSIDMEQLHTMMREAMETGSVKEVETPEQRLERERREAINLEEFQYGEFTQRERPRPQTMPLKKTVFQRRLQSAIESAKVTPFESRLPRVYSQEEFKSE